MAFAESKEGGNNLMSQQLENNEIQEILKSGTDLRQYSQQIKKDLKAVENQSIDEYIRESHNIACLHNQIGDCDKILERMESMLTNFQVSDKRPSSWDLKETSVKEIPLKRVPSTKKNSLNRHPLNKSP